MRRFVPALALFLALAGCAESAPLVQPSTTPLALADREPGPACRLLGAVEVRSGPGEDPAHLVLRDYARTRRADYVRLDGFTVLEGAEGSVVVLRARLYCCPEIPTVLVASSRSEDATR